MKNYRRLSPEEIEYTTNNCMHKSIAEIADIIERSPSTIASYLQRHSIAYKGSKVTAGPLTPTDIKYLKDNRHTMTIKQMSKVLNRSCNTLRGFMIRNSLEYKYGSNAPNRRFTIEHKKYIREHYMTMTHQELAEKLGHKKSTISYFCSRYKLHKIGVSRLTDSEKQYLISKCKKESLRTLSKKMSKPITTLQRYLQKNGITYYGEKIGRKENKYTPPAVLDTLHLRHIHQPIQPFVSIISSSSSSSSC